MKRSALARKPWLRKPSRAKERRDKAVKKVALWAAMGAPQLPKSGPTDKTLEGYWRRLVKLRAGNTCELAGESNGPCGGEIHSHHIAGRIGALEWNPDNGMCVCARCHLEFIHGFPNLAEVTIARLIGEDRYGRLEILKHRPTGEYVDRKAGFGVPPSRVREAGAIMRTFTDSFLKGFAIEALILGDPWWDGFDPIEEARS